MQSKICEYCGEIFYRENQNNYTWGEKKTCNEDCGKARANEKRYENSPTKIVKTCNATTVSKNLGKLLSVPWTKGKWA